MINKLTHTTIYVLDQDRAKDFYVNKLGFDVRDDARMGDFRWLTVGPKTQPELRIVLMQIAPGPSMNAEQCEQLRKLVTSGALGGGVLATDDCKRDYELLKAKGVEFVQPPKEEPYGTAALLKDDSGNYYSLTE